jgi:nitrous-oxide reductase
VILGVLMALVAACARGGATPVAGLPAEAQTVIRERGLSPEDVVAALRTYVPGGKYDEYA